MLLEQDLPNAACSEKSVCCYMHAENDSTCRSQTFHSHGVDGHCMSLIDKSLFVCHDIVNHHENRADGISNCLDSHMEQASFSHGHHDSSFPQNPACNEICEGMMELLSVAFYGGRAPYMSNNDVTAEVGDKAHAGS